MKFEIVKFNELSVDDMYEIAKSRFEVFVCDKELLKNKILMIRIKNVII